MATMKSAQTVYYGPSSTTYKDSGSVSNGETITVCWFEGTWAHIEYFVGSTSTKKRGYVPQNSIQDPGSPPTYTMTSATRYIHTNAKIYFGPLGTITYAELGELGRGQSVFYLGQKPNDYAFVEYTSSEGGKKIRGYFNSLNMGTSMPSFGTVEQHGRYKLHATIPTGLPFAGALVTQGFNDKFTNNKGHLGYDMIGFSAIKPIYSGQVVAIQTSNSPASGRAVCISHTVNGETFFSSYLHLSTVTTSIGAAVTTSSTIGTMGGSGYSSDTYYDPHLHLCVFTNSASTDPYGYCSDLVGSVHPYTFEETASVSGYSPRAIYYYGSHSGTGYPRCGNRRFYDSYGVITSNAGIITANKNQA